MIQVRQPVLQLSFPGGCSVVPGRRRAVFIESAGEPLSDRDLDMSYQIHTFHEMDHHASHITSGTLHPADPGDAGLRRTRATRLP